MLELGQGKYKMRLEYFVPEYEEVLRVMGICQKDTSFHSISSQNTLEVLALE